MTGRDERPVAGPKAPLRNGAAAAIEGVGHRKTALTNAERQARHRARRAEGAPVIPRHRRHPAKRSLGVRWRDAVATLIEIQAEYATWWESLPDSLRDSATGQKLESLCEADLAELESLEPPNGFGRD